MDIPVIGNGDVFTPEDFKRKMEESGVDYIMAARGAVGNPYLCRQITDYLKQGNYGKKSGLEQFAEYVELAKRYGVPFSTVKTHASSFTKGIPGGAQLRLRISQVKSLEDVEAILSDR